MQRQHYTNEEKNIRLCGFFFAFDSASVRTAPSFPLIGTSDDELFANLPIDISPNNFLKNTHTDRLLKLHTLAKDAFLYASSSVTSLITLIFLGNSIVAFSSLNSISAIALSFQKG